MKRRTMLVVALCCVLSALSLSAGEDPGASAPLPQFGPYQARLMNKQIVRDVKVDEELNIWLQLEIAHKDKEISVRISNEAGRGYRKWWHDQYDLVSPAHAGKEPLGWTDRVQVQARFIEYWMDGQLFLHLERVGS